MIRNRFIQILLLPVTAIYGLGILLRNSLYSWGILREVKFNVPVVGVGNLTLGGAGKTPHVEYLIRLLSPYVKVATLSRGYKRKTKGFRIARRGDTAETIGDEPLQYFLKYPKSVISVSESRSIGIPLLLNRAPDTQVILLDDSYQHLSVKPYINILITEYNRPYFLDFLLPTGRLREWRSGSARANIIIVSKCPGKLSEDDRTKFMSQLDPKEGQQVFFSKYIYGPLYHIANGTRQNLDFFDQILLITAIADESYLLHHLESAVPEVETMLFEDHHLFSPHEVSLMKLKFENMTGRSRAIVTTEKDATRLALHREFILKEQLPIYILPLKVSFLFDEQYKFDETIKDHLANFKV